jgi:uncharacterized protein (DUF849 family)
MITRKQKTVLTCAVTGAVTSKEQTPYLPITPEQIATSALEAAEAGAAIVHIHVRDPNTGNSSIELEHYRETVNLIRKENDKVIINLTTGPGAKFIPEPVRLMNGSHGSTMLSARVRVRHILDLKPDICSIDFNTMNEGDQKRIRLNMPYVVKDMLKMIQSVGTKPELEIFGSGDFFLAREFEAQGLFTTGKPLWQFATGVKYGIMPTPQAISYYQSMLQDDALWSAFGIGKEEMPMVATTWLYGGHVRVGIEDNVYLEKGVLAEKNSQLVEKAVRIVKDLGGEIATYEEAREIYDLPKR